MPGLDLAQMKDTGGKERAELELEQKKRELEHLNRELAKAQAAAAASEQAKRDFLAMVGHEIVRR